MTQILPLPSRAAVVEALEAVNDPHVPVSLRRMGMLREIEIREDGVVSVQVCIPCMGCPGAGMLRESVREAVMKVPGVADVVVEEGWYLPWSRDMIDPDVQEMMRANGIQV
ncbi:MAG: metal-sulfur cluster assembly factor [Alphaproteobacteria bacterium]